MEEYVEQLIITSAVEGQSIKDADRVCVEGPRDYLLTLIEAGAAVYGGRIAEMRSGTTGEVLYSDGTMNGNPEL